VPNFQCVAVELTKEVGTKPASAAPRRRRRAIKVPVPLMAAWAIQILPQLSMRIGIQYFGPKRRPRMVEIGCSVTNVTDNCGFYQHHRKVSIDKDAYQRNRVGDIVRPKIGVFCKCWNGCQWTILIPVGLISLLVVAAFPMLVLSIPQS